MLRAASPPVVTMGLINGGSVLGIRAARAAADQALTTQTVLQNATSLSFAIGPSEEWLVQFDLDVGALLSTTGLQLAANAPAGATIDFDATLSDIVVTLGNVLSGTTTTVGGAIALPAATLAGITNAGALCDLWVLNGSTAGTVQLQFAQNTSSGTALTLKKGSFMLAFRVA